MKKPILIAAALLLLAGPFAEAQERMPPGKWWRRAEVIQRLQLSRDQQARLDDVFAKVANDLIDAKGNIEKAQVALRNELDRSQLRRAEIQRILTQVNAARGRMFELELMMLVDMRGVLTEEQWEKMRDVLDRQGPRGDRQGQRDGRPGPPGGGRPPGGRRQ